MLARKLFAWTNSEIRSLHPGSFALVMATGIVSNALFLDGPRRLSDLLFLANALAYVWLAGLTIVRAVRFPGAIWSDLADPRLVFAFFSFVAATDVVGEGAYLRNFTTPAAYLWLLAFFVWLALIYVGFAVLALLNTGQAADVIHGGWLLAVVGTESLVILGVAVTPVTKGVGPPVILLVHMLWGLGLALYAIYMAQFTYRLFYFEVAPDHMTPVLWVVMGAAAISTNAGSNLIVTASNQRFLDAMLPFVDGVTLVVWGWATFWVPLLVLFEIWKYVVRRVPPTYTPLLWSAVFPLGMYSVATLRLARAGDFAALRPIAGVMLWIAVTAWIAALAALVVASRRSYRAFAVSVPAP